MPDTASSRWIQRVQPTLTLACALAITVVAAAVILSVVLLAIVHLDDRYGVSAASGVWMGLSSALRDGVLYPPIYADGFYGGTRYMPLPIVLQAGASLITSELLVSAKLLIYSTAAGLYTLLYVTTRRRGAPRPIALGLVAAVMASAAGLLTTIGFRWDALATLLQLAAIAIVIERESSRRRVVLSGLLCALALAAKISAVWAPITLVIWLAVVARRSLGWFLASLLGPALALAVATQTISAGRFAENMRLFAFGGSDSASTFEGAQRLYQLALRDQREGAVLIVLALVGVVVATLRRRIGPYEIALSVSILLLLVLMRDAGVYENHLLDLLVLTVTVLAGMWHAFPKGRLLDLVRVAVAFAILAGTLLAARYTVVPDMRAAFTHELRGRANPRFAVDAMAGQPGAGGCELYEDASIPLLVGNRPVVLDAFMFHRLQTRRPAALNLLVDRVQRRTFDRIVLTTQLSDVGWFALLDFGSKLAGTMRENYRLASHAEGSGLWIYVPNREPAAARCRPVSVRQW